MTDVHISDEHLVRNVISGEMKDFSFIVERYQKQVFGIGIRFFKNKDDSLDFAQEVFIKVYENLKSFKGWAPFKYWLIRIAYNHGKNSIKKIKEEIDFIEEYISSDNQTPENIHLNGEVKKIILKAIDRLPEQYSICLDMYFFLGLTYTQISDITEIPINTIKSNVFRAKKILRDSLKGTIAEDYHEMQ